MPNGLDGLGKIISENKTAAIGIAAAAVVAVGGAILFLFNRSRGGMKVSTTGVRIPRPLSSSRPNVAPESEFGGSSSGDRGRSYTHNNSQTASRTQSISSRTTARDLGPGAVQIAQSAGQNGTNVVNVNFTFKIEGASPEERKQQFDNLNTWWKSTIKTEVLDLIKRLFDIPSNSPLRNILESPIITKLKLEIETRINKLTSAFWGENGTYAKILESMKKVAGDIERKQLHEKQIQVEKIVNATQVSIQKIKSCLEIAIKTVNSENIDYTPAQETIREQLTKIQTELEQLIKQNDSIRAQSRASYLSHTEGHSHSRSDSSASLMTFEGLSPRREREETKRVLPGHSPAKSASPAQPPRTFSAGDSKSPPPGRSPG